MQTSDNPAGQGHARIGPWQARGIIALVAILFLVIAWFLAKDQTTAREELVRSVVADVGVVVFGLLVVDMVWQLAGGEPIQNTLRYLDGKLVGKIEESHELTGLMVHVHRLGLHGIAENQDPLRLKLADRINNSKTAIDISGWSLYLLHEHSAVQRALVQAAERGVAVRIVMPSSGAGWLAAVNKPDIVAGARSMAAQVQAQLQPLLSAGAGIHLQDRFVITSSILRFDDFLQVMPYLVSETSSNSPRLQVRGPDTPLYQLWMAEFDYLYNHGEALSAVETPAGQLP